MEVAIQIPGEVGRALAARTADVARAVLEGMASEAYRTGATRCEPPTGFPPVVRLIGLSGAGKTRLVQALSTAGPVRAGRAQPRGAIQRAVPLRKVDVALNTAVASAPGVETKPPFRPLAFDAGSR